MACNAQCLDRKRAGAAKGGRATVDRYGADHMARIGRAGFLALALRLGGGQFHATANAVQVLARRGAIMPRRDEWT